jgi:hypothetical protein
MTVGGISKTLNNSNLRKNKMQSESIAALAAALSKAQAEITGALKDSSNLFFKSKYADLASCWDACRKQLAANNLAVIQTTEVTEGGTVLVTTLAHSSGEWMRGTLPVVTKDNGPQAQGSGITYARRYALAAIVGLAQIDDDAEAAQGRKLAATPSPVVLKNIGLVKTQDELTALFKELSTDDRAVHMDAFSARKRELSDGGAA